MEYPMITLIGAARDSIAGQSVAFHEIMHMWHPMMVGNDERRHSWLDEGLTSYVQVFGQRDYFPAYRADTVRFSQYLHFTRANTEVETMRHGDLFPTDMGARTIATYGKVATVLLTLRSLVGPEVMDPAFRAYGPRWINKHPAPEDFFYSMNDLTKRDLWWFWRSWFFETWQLDQAIGDVKRDGGTLRVTIEDRGLVPMPVWLTVTRNDGKTENSQIGVEVWLKGARTTEVRVKNAATVARIEIDPGHAFPDVDWKNQTWTPPAK
jgi:hypothetical protein